MHAISRYSLILLLLSTAFLVGLGVIMLASTSVWVEPEHLRYSHVKKQIIFAIIGVAGAMVAGYTPLKWVSKLTWVLYAAGIALLILCYVPGIQVPVNGSNRWIKLPFLGQFQPSEPSKLIISLALAWIMTHFARDPRKLFSGYLVPLAVVSLPAGLIFMEKDMGTTAVVVASSFLLLYLAGTRWQLLLATTITGIIGLIAFVKFSGGNRAARLLSFRDPEGTKLEHGLQQWRSLLAFANGGVDGVGLGNGAEKHGYLPFAHTDFIFPIIGEELGLWATLSIILAFVIIAIAGILIAQRSTDLFSSLFALGLTANIVIPGAMNIAVATSMLPNTGLPLPLVSYGGTNLVFTLVSIGFLAGIYFRAPKGQGQHVNVKRARQILRL